ncbi:MAG: fibrobacter succinogenes major paralogous domain-containing protein [Saprospiraceae bacterium]|nr:fibrobacter succinogenes major paralogous domain-containing protein [Saprospiraceae bacterium]
MQKKKSHSYQPISIHSKYILALFFLSLFDALYAQEKAIIEGAITVGQSDAPSPDEGTIRWTGTDFEGWNGSTWVSLTSGPCDGLHVVKDVEANSYPTVGIGSQCWMAVNLRATLFNDGSPIPNQTAATDWGTLLTPAFCWYNDNQNNASPFGALYNWYVADSLSNGNKNVCPIGWHIPSQSDYEKLINYLGGESIAGNPMKETGNVHFIAANESATNTSGFTALPAGYRVNTFYYEGGYYAQLWTAQEGGSSTQGTFIDIEYDGNYATITDQAKTRGNSIRCIKD